MPNLHKEIPTLIVSVLPTIIAIIMSLQKITNIAEELFQKNKNHITKEDITSLENKCKKYLTETNKKMTLCVKTFNGLAIEIGILLKKEFPKETDIKTYNNIVPELVKINPVEPISLFIDKVYVIDKYRHSIKDGNDDFFIGDDHEEITKGDKDNIRRMFQFKSCWKNLKPDTQQTIKDIMAVLVDLTAKYIEEKDNGNQIADIMKKINFNY